MTRPILSLAAAALCATTLSAGAQTTFEDVVRADVLKGWELDDGRRVAGLRLTLAEGWKTYWRAPGDAGIPPYFDWSRARNVKSVDITWPTPEVFELNGMRSVGYSDQVVIPLHVTPVDAGKPVRLQATVSIGVCADICIPHEIKINTLLDASGTMTTPEIAAALSDTPMDARKAGVTASVCRLTPTSQGMRIEARVTMPHSGGQEIAVIEPGLPGVWVSEAATVRTGNSLTATSEIIHPDGRAFGLDRSRVRITVLGGNYAVDVKGCTAS
jgi:DsbC/DsbD-like thiol-disulfide interchange protein